jgi:hypothetical protein
MKRFFSIFILFLSLSEAFAQSYEKIYFKTQIFENKEMKVMVDNVIATSAGIKFKIRIFNNGDSYIIFKPSESIITIGDKKGSPNDKWMIIRPGDDDYQTIEIKGKDLLKPLDFTYEMAGLYKISMNVGAIATPDFKLPPSRNEFQTGNYSVKLGGFNKDQEGTGAKFVITYSGDKVGIIEPNKTAMKMPDGTEYANYESNYKPMIFAKGDKDDFKLTWKDIPASSGNMQTADMIILWRDAFKEVMPVKITAPVIVVPFDKDASK